VDPWVQFAIAAVAASLLMAGLWVVQRRIGNAGIVDVAWAGTIGLAALFFAATGAGDATSRWLTAVLGGVWSGRLTWYLFRRVVGHPEEGRYVALRAKWGQQAQRRFFGFFQIQAAAAVFFALPLLLLSQRQRDGWHWLDLLGIAMWTAGVVGVAVSDWQLARFRSRPENRGKTCRAGLWHYSRHPNYFFEWLHWCSYVPLVIGTSAGWLAILVPLLLLYFLFFVTGIPPTEAQALASRGEEYRSYQRTTSVFVPWFPKKDPGR
jgi:steroid 5-alpha reductase family enzyme